MRDRQFRSFIREIRLLLVVIPGSSGDHTLHFEVRNTRSEHTLNPLLFYKIRDSRIPVVRGVYLYRESASGCVGLVRRVALKTVGERPLYARTVEYSGRENRY